MISNLLLRCEICHGEFKEPKQLPCHHSFCKACLEQQVIHTATSVHLSCQTCGTRVNLLESLAAGNMPFNAMDFIQDDYFISSLIEFKHVANVAGDTGVDVRCVRHQGNKLKFYCDDCNIPVCEICRSSVHITCHADTSLLNDKKSDSIFQLDLKNLTKEMSLLDDKVSLLTESVQSKVTNLFTKKTEVQIEISAYFSNLRTKMNEHLYKLEQQLNNEYTDLLQGQTDTNKEYQELCNSFTKRCNSVKELVENLYDDYHNAKNRNKKTSLLQIVGETKLTTEDGIHTINCATSSWTRNPNLEFVVHSSKERELFNVNIAVVDVIYPNQQHNGDESCDSSNASAQDEILSIDGLQVVCRDERAVSVASNNMTNGETIDENNALLNTSGQEISISSTEVVAFPESGTMERDELSLNDGIGTQGDLTVNSIEPVPGANTSQNSEQNHATAMGNNSSNISAMSVFLPTVPPVSDLLYDELPPPYSPGIIGEWFNRPLRPSVISTHGPPPPYPGLPSEFIRPPTRNANINIPGAASNTRYPRQCPRESRSRHQVTMQLVNSFSFLKPEDRATGSFVRILWVKYNQFLIVDRWNSKIRLFHENGKVLSGATFKGAEPWDITALSERQYGVAFPKSNKICMICLSEKPDIVVTGWKSTQHGYICIAYFHRDDVFICGTAAPFSEASIDIVKYKNTQLCRVIRSFRVDPYGSPIFQYPRSIKVTEEGMIAISDYTMNCVTFVSIDGFVVGKYKGMDTSHLFEPLGICLDPVNKDVYIAVTNVRAVCETAPACIHRVTMNGDVLGIIPKEVGLDGPKELSVIHLPDGTIKIVVTKGNGVVQLFRVQL